jgi:ligand-binding SRPBCC domain-containing protein
MVYRHRFLVHVPLEEVARFHACTRSMRAITPPPVIVQLHASPVALAEGDEMEFTLWLLFLPVRWRARVEQVSARGFTDVQLSGPFRSWRHRHEFTLINATTTEVNDTVEATISPNLFQRLIGWGMWASLPLLFAYRSWKTRQLLEPTR